MAMRSVTGGGITSSPTGGWLSMQSIGVTQKAATPGCCIPGEMETQPRNIHPCQHKPGRCHQGIPPNIWYFWGA